jgi:hypothetical protein
MYDQFDTHYASTIGTCTIGPVCVVEVPAVGGSLSVHGAAASVYGVEAQRSMHASGAPTCPRLWYHHAHRATTGTDFVSTSVPG